MTFNANLVRGLQSTVRHNGPRPAILDGERTYTWAEFGGRVARLAGALRSMGVSAGSRFAILSRNGFRAEELKWAGVWLGAVPVPVNWRLAAPEIAHMSLATRTAWASSLKRSFTGISAIHRWPNGRPSC
jgi:acyl-CoA synthetase (AMP-forming)/AMP-acid ligase II